MPLTDDIFLRKPLPRAKTLLFLLATLVGLFPPLVSARSMEIPSQLQDRVVLLAINQFQGLPAMDRTTPEFRLAAYDQIKQVREAINAHPDTPAWMKAANIGVISLNDTQTRFELRFPESLGENDIRSFYRQFLYLHARTIIEAEFQIVDSLEQAVRSQKANIETEKDPLRRQLLQSLLGKTQAELREHQLL